MCTDKPGRDFLYTILTLKYPSQLNWLFENSRNKAFQICIQPFASLVVCVVQNQRNISY